MSFSNKRQPSYGSSILSQSSDSLDFEEEENPNSNRNLLNSSGKKDLLENDIFFHTNHSDCFSQFIDELSKSLSLRLSANSMSDLTKAIQSSINNLISCTVLELKSTIDECYKAISLFEDYNQTTSNLYFGNFVFTIKITDKDLAPGSKSEISKNFASFSSEQKKPLEAFQSFTQELEKNLAASYKDSFSFTEVSDITSSKLYRCAYLKELEDFNLRKRNLETYSIKKEIEWERHEIKTMKGQIKSKQHDFLYKEKLLKEETCKISSQRVKLAKEKDLLEREQEKLESRKAKFFKIQETVKDLVSQKRLELNTSHISNCSFTSADPAELLEDEQKTLEKERDELRQALSQASAEVQNSLKMQIDKIETRISTIRSEKLINASQKRSLKVNSVLSKIQTSMAIKQVPIPRLPLSTSQKSIIPQLNTQGRRTAYTPVPFALAHHVRSPTYTQMSPLIPSGPNRSGNTTPIDVRLDFTHKKSESFLPSDFRSSLETEEKDENSEPKLRSLVLKEARLQQKEEEILKKENVIKASMDRRVTDREVLEIIKTERMGINRKTKEIEAKERKLEELFMEAEKFENRVRSRNKELDRVQSEIENERRKLELEKDEWYARYEDVQKIIAENLGN